MSKRIKETYSEDFAFYQQLWYFYQNARGKIRTRYNPLTKKFLDYNDSEKNPNAFLRLPQFEALEMYIFIKEFLDNRQVIEIFEQWVKQTGDFSERSYYFKERLGLFTPEIEKQTSIIFKQMEKYRTDYPNYIYALTMGLGKTILMATCIFYEFLLSNKYPKDTRYCHNALVFAPDKTVLQSLREIVTFDKTKVVPPEYASVLDANIKIHFLDDTSTSLNTIDNSNLNIVISNNQKIIVKQSHKEQTPADKIFQPTLLSSVNDDEDLVEAEDLLINKRFHKLCRLPQIGIYVDEAHHLFGSNLDKELHSNKETSLRMTINMLAERLKTKGTNVVACYNYTGTPYVEKQVLPEVVYAYGLRESINAGFLKEADIKGFDNVKDIEFLKSIINGYTDSENKKAPGFLDIYKKQTFEGLLPKLAIYAATIDEIRNIIKPALEKLLSEKGIPLSKILVNVGDGNPDLTRDDDIRHFNNLDVIGTEGSQKQFILLCEKGKEGWNCRSLFGVALFRDSFSKVFVLQSTMRCLRQIKADKGPPKQETATVYLSQANYSILDAELNKNFNMSIKELTNKNKKEKKPYQVRMVLPPRKITIKEKRYSYTITKKDRFPPIDFAIDKIAVAPYQRKVTEKTKISGITQDTTSVITDVVDKTIFSAYTLVAEIARYFPEAGALKIEDILEKSKSGSTKILEIVNAYNEVLYEHIIPKIFHSIYEISGSSMETEREIILLKKPEGMEYYEFYADPALVAFVEDKEYLGYKDKSFHANYYCFDSRPEYECFKKFLLSDKVENVYFTGMFTSQNQSGFAIPYTDPDSHRYRNYYPDFLIKMKNGDYQIIEVKGDNKLDDTIVKAKKEAAISMAINNEIIYRMIAGSAVSQADVDDPINDGILQYPDTTDGFDMEIAADSGEIREKGY